MKEDILREQLIKYKKEYGTTLTFLHKELGINRTLLSLFLHDKKNISEENYWKLTNYINSKSHS